MPETEDAAAHGIQPMESIPLHPLRYEHDALDTAPHSSQHSDKDSWQSFSYGRRRRPRVISWLPALVPALSCLGTVAGLLSWLLVRRIQDHLPSEDPQFRGALVAIEGPSSAPTTNPDGTVNLNATLYGLTVATIASQLVSFATPIVIGVFALRLAANWVSMQQGAQKQAMPTAAQYGLVIGLCSSPSLMSVFEAGSYLRMGKKRRASAASLLSAAVSVVVLLLSLSYAVSIVDIWLHSTASAFVHMQVNELSPDALPALGSQVDLAICPGPTEIIKLEFPGSAPNNYTNCQHFQTQSVSAYVDRWGNASLINEGLATLKNESNRFQPVLVDKYAVLVSASRPLDVMNVTFDTFGIAVDCQPIADCSVDDVETYPDSIVFCPSFHPPLNISSVTYPSSVQAYNLSGNVIAGDGSGRPGSGTGYALDSHLNPYGALVTLTWDVTKGSVVFPDMNVSPGWYHAARAVASSDYYFYVAGCSVSVYNVSLRYSAAGIPGSGSAPSYLLRSEPALSNFNTTSALLASLDDLYQQRLVQYIQDTLTPSLNVSESTFNSVLSNNMSFGMLALASPLLKAQHSTSGRALTQRVASRYPLAPLCILAALVGTYGLVSLFLAFSAACASSREVLVNPDSDSGKGGPVRTEAEHVQMRLTDPLVSVAERFAEPERRGMLFEASAVEMFREHPWAERVHVESPAAGPDGTQTPPGLFRRWRPADNVSEP